MLTVTDSALQHFYKAIDQSNDSGACFRMITQADKTLGLILDSPADGDKTFEHEGTTVLAMPESLAKTLSQRTLDIDGGGQLVLAAKPS